MVVQDGRGSLELVFGECIHCGLVNGCDGIVPGFSYCHSAVPTEFLHRFHIGCEWSDSEHSLQVWLCGVSEWCLSMAKWSGW